MLLLTWTSCRDFDADDMINAYLGNETSLALFISTHGNVTRMADDVVQEEGSVYRGLDILSITPFAIDWETFANHGLKIVDTDVSSLQLGDRSPVDLTTTQAFYLYKSYSMTIGTNAFLVYGRAPVNGRSKAQNGSLLFWNKEGDAMTPLSGLTTPNLQKLRFTLEPIHSQAVSVEAELLAGYLNHIAQANTGDENVTWRKTSDPKLKESFLFFTGQDNEENMVLAGSSANVMAHVDSLYDKVSVLTYAENSDGAKLRADILDRIKNDYTSGDNTLTVTTDAGGKLTGFSINNYPANHGLPDGAAALRWVVTETESGKVYGFAPRTETTPQDNINDISRFSYPAELFYYVNSRIDTSNSPVGEEVYNSYSKWEDVRNRYEYQPGMVNVNTRSVAIHEPLQYAVGRLKMSVKATAGTLKDSKGRDVTLNNAFPLTGVIICNQHPVDFNFKPVLDNGVAASHVYDRFIYDSQVGTSCYLTTSEQSIPSTLVLQTYDTGEGNDKKGAEEVNIVMEFRNDSGKAFYGKSCVIYPGTKFYLIGKANPLEATSSSETPESKGRVFTQDHVTTVNTKVESLANAYNVLPDLIGGRLELGVELVSSWVQAETTNVILK